METAQNNLIKLVKPDPGHAQEIARNLQEAGHRVSLEEIIPHTAETAFPETPELSEVGGEIVGKDPEDLYETLPGSEHSSRAVDIFTGRMRKLVEGIRRKGQKVRLRKVGD